jgi:hypothetical protein
VSASAAHHAQDISGGGLLILIMLAWWLAGKVIRNVAASHRAALEARHRRRVELACAKAAHRLPGIPAEHPEAAPVPAAVIPAPPGARVTNTSVVPGPCRHEKIVPVITGDGDVVRWLCANYPRCTAEFGPDTAVYESAPWGGDHPGNQAGDSR